MKNAYWVESLEAIFESHGVIVDRDKLTDIADDVALSAELRSESTGEIYIPNPLESDVNQLKHNIKELKQNFEERDRQFHSNVARRHNCSIHDVYINSQGDVEVRI